MDLHGICIHALGEKLNAIAVTELCEAAKIERSTFCANLADISGLVSAHAEKWNK